MSSERRYTAREVACDALQRPDCSLQRRETSPERLVHDGARNAGGVTHTLIQSIDRPLPSPLASCSQRNSEPTKRQSTTCG